MNENIITTILDAFLVRRWAGAAIVGLCFILGGILIPSFTLLGFLFLFLAVLLALGAVVSMRKQLNLPRPIGKVLDVDGNPMHIFAEGECNDSHPVIWVSGGHGEGLLMIDLHQRIKAETRSILFDRAGSGWSGLGKLPLSISDEVAQLNQLLKSAGESGPFVLAGHSFGGLFSVNFAHHYPELVAGLLLLDPTPPWNVAFAGPLSFAETLRKSRWRALAAHFGLTKLIEPEIDDKESAYYQVLSEYTEVINAHSIEPKSLIAEASIFRTAMLNPFDLVVGENALTDIPLILLSENPTKAEREQTSEGVQKQLKLTDLQVDNLWKGLEQSIEEQVRLSSRGERRMGPSGCSHMFPYEQPELVIDAVRELISV